MGPRRPCLATDWTETGMNRSSFLVYICQAVKNRAGLERYWQVARYPENIDVLVGYGPFEVLDADQDERVEGVVLAEFPPFEQTVEWFNGDAYVQARKNREGNEYLGMLVDSGVTPISKRKPRVQTECPHACLYRLRLPWNCRPGGAQYLLAAREYNVGGSPGPGLN